MSAIAGCWSHSTQINPDDACALMAGALRPFAPEKPQVRRAGPVSFARRLRRLVPEDDWDQQPLASDDGRQLFVADVRLDNRDEVSQALGLPAGGEFPDAEILFRCWQKWGPACLDRLIGDYAFAVWDAAEESLTLVRAPMALKSLYYHADSKAVAFATVPSALTALPFVGKRLDAGFAASLVADVYPVDGSTAYVGVRKVLHGHAVRLSKAGERSWRFWEIRKRDLGRGTAQDYAAGMRHELDRSVAAQLRRHHGEVGSQLSSGRDSSAVTATAARIVSPERLFAFTAAPREGFPALDSEWLIADESPIAAETAAAHPNVSHQICRRDTAPMFGVAGECHLLHQEPLPNLVSLPWWWAIDRHAQELGVSVLLTGTAGNYTISARGDSHLPDLLQAGGLRSWWRAASGLVSGGHRGWLDLLHISVGPWLPPSVYGAVMRLTGRGFVFQRDTGLLREPHASAMRRQLSERLTDVRPPKNYRGLREQLLYEWIMHENMSLARWGVEVRDPCSDRRLIDYCMSIPVEVLASGPSPFATYDAAFEDRLPLEVRSLRQRGDQSADWFERIDAEQLLRLVEHYWQSPLVADLIDREAVTTLARRWPGTGAADATAARPFRYSLISAMMMANFIAVTFDGLPPLPEGSRATI